jgi:predicted transcriptional regulator
LILLCFRAIVLHEVMNVTLKLPDELCKAARHLAVDESKSLSAWMAELVKRELEVKRKPERRTIAELLADPATSRKNFELPDRKNDVERENDFI